VRFLQGCLACSGRTLVTAHNNAVTRADGARFCCVMAARLCLHAALLNGSALIHREDLFTNSDAGVRIHVREVRLGARGACRPILLVHGARVPGIASFDLPVPGGSLAGDLADKGFCVYVMDVRGYGQSTRPSEMEQPSQNHPPLVRSLEAVHDIDAAVDLIRKRTAASRVFLFGWATGGQWAGYYATLHSGKLSHLILLNALYGADAPHPLMGHGSDMEDPAYPGRLHPAIGAYRCNSAESLLGGWDRSIPAQDKATWRDPAVAEAYVRGALASDPETNSHHPPCFRSPNGALEDSFYLATGRQLWDASFIYVPTLVLASERDFWSRPADREKIRQDLVHASIRVVVIPNATHFVHLDRPGAPLPGHLSTSARRTGAEIDALGDWGSARRISIGGHEFESLRACDLWSASATTLHTIQGIPNPSFCSPKYVDSGRFTNPTTLIDLPIRLCLDARRNDCKTRRVPRSAGPLAA